MWYHPVYLDLRAASVEDITALRRLPRSIEEVAWAFPDAPRPLHDAGLKDCITRCTETVVGVYRGRVIAFGGLGRIQPGGYAFLRHLIVHPDYRGRGVGTRVLRHLTQRAFEHHRSREMHLRISSRNIPATLFFYELGFLPYGILSGEADPYGGGLMRLRLRWGDLEEE
ncbi:hypothetical protein M911_10405 [Ectothiorhodospira haloalkaliphila]|uniref:N-acetyltransferase domain-containing protein n=1 Tax=Ectothiorhodospira haloalkaliphila TaxID=421628 RepID=W8KNJ6_9GAMM|nr:MULTISPECIES: GNAT family N-acetyltransferase [Ectothiorhodospira]AHK80718.1 hypothetical protein M911_10405 [Ectothiorhodospira haloalkaliphila]MCG5495135.1 GNAT family N-acetyltransferase [Ectothiorhodospira variabilis]MCG5503829.1 GNAT family N-acetyltransferase [Ectothiorhodospira variabilis]MCG5507040.1 GNAT family N-acetyltransferase [Ectothiorhodospira variabilis]MCG5525560.1 GNAT family N-acetyltransferase [Ectothiorhodospira haloalkaliphila]